MVHMEEATTRKKTTEAAGEEQQELESRVRLSSQMQPAEEEHIPPSSDDCFSEPSCRFSPTVIWGLTLLIG